MAARFGHIRSYLKKQTNEGAAGMSAVCTDIRPLSAAGTAHHRANARPGGQYELVSQLAWYKISVRPMASPKLSCVIVD
jgi:hypothetical protein